jgi:lon-related putative ATP-dependent protease
MVTPLPAEKLRWSLDPKKLDFKTTAELKPAEEIIGQIRAIKSLRFGLGIRDHGFNIYVAGFHGTGRTTAVKAFLEKLAAGKPVPPDWCYVNNFKDPYQPRAIRLPAGKGKEFTEEMRHLITEVRRKIPEVFDGEEYAARREETVAVFRKKRDQISEQMTKRAETEGFVFQSTPMGVFIVPLIKGKPATEEDVAAIGADEQAVIAKKREQLENELKMTMRQIHNLERTVNDEVKALDRQVTLHAVGHLVNELEEKYKKFPDVVGYMNEVQEDILANLSQFRSEPEAQAGSPFQAPWLKEQVFRKYEVNVVVDNAGLKGAPVVIETNPTYPNLIGRIEKEAQFGALLTDFTMIRAGMLHRANGGYLVLPIYEVLINPYSWEGIKLALRNREITIEEIAERLGYVTTKGIRPQPVPLDVKVVLIGTPAIYHLLYAQDEEFNELFKVKADFDTVMERTEANVKQYTHFICGLWKKENLQPCDASAAAKILEYGARLADHQEKLSTRFLDVADIMREANFWAKQDEAKTITAQHVQKAIEEKVYRSNLIQEKLKEFITKDIYRIDTIGAKVGQVNGLAVIDMGDFAFGRPSRITVSIGVGREGIFDIEREAKLGGPIHTKGVLILAGYLAEQFAQDKPLTLSARLVFEQSYDEVEGDSASSTELYAILSHLSGLPIKQSIAVTGSVNQKGEVQAIGGVNEKLEGFFEICKAKGLTGEQGAVIPESNVKNLMLKEELVEAVKKGKFHIYPVKTINEGIEVLTGVKAGERKKGGSFEKGTVNDLVDRRLRSIAQTLKAYMKDEEGAKKSKPVRKKKRR